MNPSDEASSAAAAAGASSSSAAAAPSSSPPPSASPTLSSAPSSPCASAEPAAAAAASSHPHPPPDADELVAAEGNFAAESKYERLHHLLDQTSLFSKFLSERMPARYDASKAAGSAASSGAAAAGGSPSKPQLADRTSSLKALLPANSGLELHSFQIVGIDWLISLYENGLNGILADGL